MSQGRGYAEFTSGLRSELAVDLPEVEDPSASCGVSTCEENPVYRVPWPSVGGDVAYCPYHLARYGEQYPELWARVQDAVDEDLTAFTTQGDRFLTFEDVPQTLFGDEFRAIAVLVTGHAPFEEREPGKIVGNSTVDLLDECAYVELLSEDSEFPDLEECERVRQIVAERLLDRDALGKPQRAD